MENSTFKLYDYQKYFLDYLIELYGGEYKIVKHFLFFSVGRDNFKVSLLDGSRFNEWSFFHQNKYGNENARHLQLKCRDFEYGLFRCFTHDFNQTYGIPYSPEDFLRFREDAIKYKRGNIQ